MIFQPVLHPLLLVLLFAPVVALAVWLIVRGPSTGRETQGAGSGTARAKSGARVLWGLRLLLILACFVMLLRPGIPGGATQTLATDTDIVLVVDTTASIVAEDWDDGQPRLDGVREDVRAIVEEYPGARFALITSDAAAELRMPLTTDTTALIGSLDVLRPEVTSQSRGSSIGIAAPLLSETLAAAAESSPDRARMVFYFGDGEQTVGTPPEPFTTSAKYTDAGAVFGYGTTEGGPMRITGGGLGADEGYIEYEGGNALSVIDEANLETVAEQLGVEYEHRTADAAPTLPAAPSTTTSYAESGEVGNVTELYWIAALVIVALLGVELLRATMLIARLRQLKAPRSSVVERGAKRRDETRSTTEGGAS
ncbi:VWA domain-containing protein [Microbacterium sp. EST19A]|uniref:VWA domain-containing protein n=1 Tax=Microbacterium sp. EST19A TaxID=2862681 RepID=UPI001CBAF36E|nr:VWA domain-containing protein [Microbacterium sp. EST19A]